VDVNKFISSYSSRRLKSDIGTQVRARDREDIDDEEEYMDFTNVARIECTATTHYTKLVLTLLISYRRYDALISAPCVICPWIHIHVMSVAGVLSAARVTLKVGHIVKQRIVGGAQQFGEYHGRGSSGAAGLDDKRAWFGWIGSASVEGDAQLHPIGARVGGLNHGFDQIGGDCAQA